MDVLYICSDILNVVYKLQKKKTGTCGVSKILRIIKQQTVANRK